MTWRDDANRVIQQAISEISAEIRSEKDVGELFKYISLEYYPFGERKYFPYKAWLSAIAKNKEAYIKQMKPTEPIDYNVGMFKDVQ